MALLRGWWHPYTPRGKTRCWSLCARLCQSAILPLKFRSNNAEDDAGRLGSSPSLPAVRLISSQRISRRVCVRQNAQDKSKAGRSIFVRDKGRWSLAPPTQVTSPRNAGRFKGLDVSDSRSQRWSVGITLDVTGGQVPPQVRMAQGLLECTCRVHLEGHGPILAVAEVVCAVLWRKAGKAEKHLKKWGAVNKKSDPQTPMQRVQIAPLSTKRRAVSTGKKYMSELITLDV